MSISLLLALGVSLCSSFVIIEGLVRGRICAQAFEFDRLRQPFSFWLTVAFFSLMAVVMWVAYLHERGII